MPMIINKRQVIVAVAIVAVLVAGASISAAGYENSIDADRSIDATELAPGETTTVEVTIDANEPSAIEFADSFDPGFEDVTVIEDSDADLSSARSDEVIATWGLTDEATISYDVTVHNNATPGDQVQLNGTVTADEDDETRITGDNTIDVIEGDGDDDDSDEEDERDVPDEGAERIIESTEVVPGESTTVTVSIGLESETAQLNWGVDFEPAFADAEIIQADDVEISGAEPDEVFAVWFDTDFAVVEYEVTVPVDSDSGDTYTFSGSVDTDEGVELDITGDDTIEVIDTPTADGNISVDEQSVPSGGQVTVTEATANVPYAIVVTNEQGDQLGATEPLDADEKFSDSIEFESPIGQSDNVTLTLHSVDNGEIGSKLYMDDSPISASVPIWVGKDAYAIDDGTVPRQGVFNAISDWSDDTIDRGTVFDVISSWQSGERVR